jgi:hypothetical protein
MRKICLVISIIVSAITASRAQEVVYKGFLDVGGSVDKNYSTFNFGGFDNYISSQITDKLSVVGEILIEPLEGHEFRVDVERIHVTYEFNDKFKMKIGRFYAPIGYYTTRFYSDHAAIFTPSISRPVILSYEDDGGVLETRATGIMMTASNLTSLNLTYDLALSNGIGSSVAGDNDKNKAVTMRLSMSPMESVTIGGGARFDNLDASTISRATNVALGENMTTNNFSGFGAFNNDKLLIMAEYYSISNRSASAGTVNSEGAFGYAGYTFKKVTPYVQYDYLNISDKDVYYSSANNESGFDVGIKYAFTFKSVLKTEYHIDTQTLYFQYAIGF